MLKQLLDKLPARIPHVSILDVVLDSASNKNFVINIVGTRTVRRPVEVYRDVCGLTLRLGMGGMSDRVEVSGLRPRSTTGIWPSRTGSELSRIH
jgi:hypothetical protein